MSTNSSYCSNVNLPKRSKEIQREASKAAESLERLLCLAKRGEDVKSKKSEEAIDFAIEKLRFLKSSTVQLGELKQVIENLENVVTEKKFEGRKRLEEISCKVEETRMQVEALSREREVLSAQVMAGNALCKLEKEGVHRRDADGESSDSIYYSHGSVTPGDRIAISDYCKGDWDDKVTGDFLDK